jgi:hypothetical protein
MTMKQIRSPTDRRPGFLNWAPTFDVRQRKVYESIIVLLFFLEFLSDVKSNPAFRAVT